MAEIYWLERKWLRIKHCSHLKSGLTFSDPLIKCAACGGGPVCNFFRGPNLCLGDVKIITGSRGALGLTHISRLKLAAGHKSGPSSLHCGPPQSRTAGIGVSAEQSGVTHNSLSARASIDMSCSAYSDVGTGLPLSCLMPFLDASFFAVADSIQS